MNYKECKEQLEGLIEHFNNGGRDFNATDIIAIKKTLSKIQKQKEVIDKAINWTKEYTMQWDSEDDVISDMEILLNILKEVERLKKT